MYGYFDENVMGVAGSSFKKREDHKVIYISGQQ